MQREGEDNTDPGAHGGTAERRYRGHTGRKKEGNVIKATATLGCGVEVTVWSPALGWSRHPGLTSPPPPGSLHVFSSHCLG